MVRPPLLPASEPVDAKADPAAALAAMSPTHSTAAVQPRILRLILNLLAPNGRLADALPGRNASRPAVDVVLRLCPGQPSHRPAHAPGVEVTLLEVDPAEASGHAGLVGRLREGVPAQREVGGGHRPRFHPRAAGRQGD